MTVQVQNFSVVTEAYFAVATVGVSPAKKTRSGGESRSRQHRLGSALKTYTTY
jgi:hypothetical protein